MQSFFVSSTFKDMQGERDALHRTVMPRLREKAAQNGENIQFIDLRWGISTTDMDNEDSTAKILGVCLQEVKNCKPYMIVLLGERYGWIPLAQQILEAGEQVEFTPEDTQISVTELEIRYGMYLADQQLDRCIFCLREPVTGDLTPEQKAVYLAESDEDARRMTALREKIKNTPGAKVISYSLNCIDGHFTGYEEFSQQLYQALEELMLPRWAAGSALTWQQRQQEEDAITGENHLRRFVERKAVLDKLSDAVANNQIVCLEGEGGCGKSALMAKLNQTLQTAGKKTALFFCGNSINCMHTEQLMRLILWHLDSAEGKTTPEAAQGQLRERYRQRMANYAGPEMVLFVDAIDQLAPDQGLFESWFIPPQMSEKIRMVLSTTGAVRINPSALSAFVFQRMQLTPPEREELRAILNARFAAEHKQLSHRVADKLLDNPCSQNMLGMEIMVRRLVMLDQQDFAQIAQLEQTMDGASAIDTYLVGIIEKFDTILPLLISNYFYDVSRFLTPEDYGISQLPLYIIGIMQHGVSAAELESISEMIHTDKAFENLGSDHIWRFFWNPVSFSRMKRYMGGLLVERSDGRIDFSHRLLRNAIRDNKAMVYISPILREWLLSLPPENTCRLENILPVGRRAEEWVYTERKNDSTEGSLIRECFESPIRNAGKLRNSGDPEGVRQLDILTRSVVEDITGGYSSHILDYYCMILRNMILEGCGPNSYPIWFFGDSVVSALSRLGQKEMRYALQILSCILAGLHNQKDSTLAANWAETHKHRFLVYHRKALDIFATLTEEFHLGNIKLEYYEGMSAEVIFTKGCELADAYIREDSANVFFRLDKAALYAQYAKKLTLAASWGLKESPSETFCPLALDCVTQALTLPATTAHREDALRSGAICLESIHTNAFGRVFGKSGALRYGDQLAQRVWELAVPEGNTDDLGVQYIARFKRAWSRCLDEKGSWSFGKKQTKYQQQALDLCLDYYYAVRQDPRKKLNEADRRYLGELGVQAALLLLAGEKPALAEKKAVTAEQILGYIAKWEASYFQAEARRDFQSRWYWAIMLCAELIDAGVNKAHRRQNAKLAVSILTNLLKTIKDKGEYLNVRDTQVQTCFDFANRFLSMK